MTTTTPSPLHTYTRQKKKGVPVIAADRFPAHEKGGLNLRGLPYEVLHRVVHVRGAQGLGHLTVDGGLFGGRGHGPGVIRVPTGMQHLRQRGTI